MASGRGMNKNILIPIIVFNRKTNIKRYSTFPRNLNRRNCDFLNKNI